MSTKLMKMATKYVYKGKEMSTKIRSGVYEVEKKSTKIEFVDKFVH